MNFSEWIALLWYISGCILGVVCLLWWIRIVTSSEKGQYSFGGGLRKICSDIAREPVFGITILLTIAGAGVLGLLVPLTAALIIRAKTKEVTNRYPPE